MWGFLLLPSSVLKPAILRTLQLDYNIDQKLSWFANHWHRTWWAPRYSLPDNYCAANWCVCNLDKALKNTMHLCRRNFKTLLDQDPLLWSSSFFCGLKSCYPLKSVILESHGISGPLESLRKSDIMCERSLGEVQLDARFTSAEQVYKCPRALQGMFSPLLSSVLFHN